MVPGLQDDPALADQSLQVHPNRIWRVGQAQVNVLELECRAFQMALQDELNYIEAQERTVDRQIRDLPLTYPSNFRNALRAKVGVELMRDGLIGRLASEVFAS